MNRLSVKEIGQRIYNNRGHRVMLDSDLAELYGTNTKALNRSVRRNLDRFPAEFMLQLTKKEHANLKHQIGTSSLGGHGGRRSLPMAFTEYGVVMLSSVLNSDGAVQVNIAVVKAFVKIRELSESHQYLAAKFDQLEKKFLQHDNQFKAVFEAIRQLMAVGAPPSQKRIIGLRGK